MFKIKLLTPTAIAPQKAYNGDAGFDVFSAEHTLTMGFGERHKFRLGFALELPHNWVALIQEKSGQATNNGIFTMGNVIDSGYRGECHAILCCMSQKPVTIEHGQKIAQMLVIPCYTGKYFQVVDALSETSRGENGFGSTGLGYKRCRHNIDIARMQCVHCGKTQEEIIKEPAL